MDQSKYPLQNEGYMLEELDGELLLYHLDQTKTVYLNNSAAVVWHLCDGTNTVADIIALLTAQFPESADAIPDDVHETLRSLRDAGALSLD